MRIYSGNYCMSDVGIPTDEIDMHGNELFTGDIVQLWHGNWIGEEFEEWMPSSGLTAIVSDQYQSFTTKIIKNSETPRPYTMGIKATGVQGESWKVALVKSHKDIINGERFPSFGFSFKEAEEREILSAPFEDQIDEELFSF